jgi:hypothetical protein
MGICPPAGGGSVHFVRRGGQSEPTVSEANAGAPDDNRDR